MDLASPKRRIAALDGLRGLAALVVAIHHSALTVPQFGAPDPPVGQVVLGSTTWWSMFTPLHLLWNGRAAVYLFFVLSGFVLTLPVLGESFDWRSYYPQRLARLYLPVWGALVLAFGLVLVVPRAVSPTQSVWTNELARPIQTATALHDSLLLGGAGWLDSPLWSLRWEVAFSLLLPLFVFAAFATRRVGALSFVLLLALVWLASPREIGLLIFLPMFGIGVLLAVHRQLLMEVAQRVQRPARLISVIVALLLINATYLPWAIVGSEALVTAGAALLVVAFLAWPGPRAVGEHRVVQWLGSRSFSLYLVHEPVILACVFLLGPPLGGALGLLISFAVCELFFRSVERPGHRLARTIGAVIRNRSTPVVPR